MAAKPPRLSWDGFPDVLLHASESAVKQHPRYPAAKSGDAEAAIALVHDTLNPDQVRALGAMFPGETPTLVSAHAYEREGVNAIPEALADELGRRLDWPVDSEIVQSNIVAHTGAGGFERLARQATFDGPSNPAFRTSSSTTSSGWAAHWPTCAAIFTRTAVKSLPRSR